MEPAALATPWLLALPNLEENAMVTTTRQTKAGQIDRNLTVGLRCENNHVETYAIVVETLHRKTTTTTTTTDYYILRRIPSEFGGIAVEIEKQYADGEVYHVHDNTCDCPAGIYRGSCRHLEMVKEALRRGLI
jgi:hypothetical protein